MAEESVAEGILARLEKGEDIGDVLRDDIERREGLRFGEWARTTDGWQGIATATGGAGTVEETPPRRVRRDDPDLNILFVVIMDFGTKGNDEAGTLAYFKLLQSTFYKADFDTVGLAKLSDLMWTETSVGEFANGLYVTLKLAEDDNKLYDQIHFVGHGDVGVGMLFDGEPFDSTAVDAEVSNLRLKPNGVIVLFGCFTQSGPFYDWAVRMAMEAGPGAEVCAFEGDLVYKSWPVGGDEERRTTDWDYKENKHLKKIYNKLFGLPEENE
jgi:hypothetical protein